MYVPIEVELLQIDQVISRDMSLCLCMYFFSSIISKIPMMLSLVIYIKIKLNVYFLPCRPILGQSLSSSSPDFQASLTDL